jgi:hypothetical protein
MGAAHTIIDSEILQQTQPKFQRGAGSSNVGFSGGASRSCSSSIARCQCTSLSLRLPEHGNMERLDGIARVPTIYW